MYESVLRMKIICIVNHNEMEINVLQNRIVSV